MLLLWGSSLEEINKDLNVFQYSKLFPHLTYYFLLFSTFCFVFLLQIRFIFAPSNILFHVSESMWFRLFHLINNSVFFFFREALGNVFFRATPNRSTHCLKCRYARPLSRLFIGLERFAQATIYGILHFCALSIKQPALFPPPFPSTPLNRHLREVLF